MMALGATHYNWRPDVQRIVNRIRRNFMAVTVNTYVGHPFPRWGNVSLDVWGPDGRGSPIHPETGKRIRAWLMDLEGEPYIRHTIWEHDLWTSWGGYSTWPADDHSGDLRHLHVTYWK